MFTVTLHQMRGTAHGNQVFKTAWAMKTLAQDDANNPHPTSATPGPDEDFAFDLNNNAQQSSPPPPLPISSRREKEINEGGIYDKTNDLSERGGTASPGSVTIVSGPFIFRNSPTLWTH